MKHEVQQALTQLRPAFGLGADIRDPFTVTVVLVSLLA